MSDLDSEDDDDGVSGELIPTEHFSCWDSEIAPGDLVIVRVRHRAFRGEQLPELAGRVKDVLSGHDITYIVEVLTTGELPWPDLLVQRKDIVRAWA